MKSAGRLAILGVLLGVLSQSCGSSDGRKAAPGPVGGEGGEGALPGAGGGGAPNAAVAGAGGAPVEETPASAAGSGGETPMSAAGAAGSAGEGPLTCGPGYGDCDDDPTDCEQSLNELDHCGQCGSVCGSDHAVAACEDGACVLTCEEGFGDCNGSSADGCETSLIENDEHCGECARDCTSVGATCTVDSCGDILMQTGVSIGIGNGPFNDHAFAFSPSVGIAAITRTNAVVQLFPLDGSPGKVIWNTNNGGSSTEALLIAGQEVYWAESGTPASVRKKPASAAPDVTPTNLFFPDSVPVYLRRQGDYLYWITGDYSQASYVYRRLMTAPSNDKGTQLVSISQGSTSSASHLRGFAVTTDAIYWQTMDDGNAATTDGDIRTVPLTGGAPTSVPPVPGATDGVISEGGNLIIPPSLTAVGDTLYFARTIGSSPLNGVYSFKKGDAAPKQLVAVGGVTTLAFSESSLYYGLLNQQGVWRAPIAGGQSVKVGQSYQSVIVGTDAQFAYVAFVNQPSYFYKVFR